VKDCYCYTKPTLLFNRYAVVLNGYDILREALVKRSADFVGRERIYAEYTAWNPELRGWFYYLNFIGRIVPKMN